MAEQDKSNSENLENSHKDDEVKKKANSQDSSESIDNEFPEDIPQRIVGEKFMGMMMSQVRGGVSELAGKLKDNHIDKLLELSGKESEREYQDKKNQRNFILIVVIIAILVLVFLTIYLAKDHENTFMRILIPILAFMGGLGTGYGVGKHRQ